MGYAINSEQTGWRYVESEADVVLGETYSEAQPILQVQQTPEWMLNRRANYPEVDKALNSIWGAMDANIIPKAEPWYSDRKAVNDAYPET